MGEGDQVSISLIGTGQFSRELQGWAKVDPNVGDVIEAIEPDDLKPGSTSHFLAIGDPQIRFRVFDQCSKSPVIWASPIVFDFVRVAPDVSLARGVLVMHFVSLASGSSVGEHSHLHGGSVIGHGVEIGSFCTIGANCFVGGEVSVGDRVQMYPGVSIAPGVRIAPDVVLGIGSTVIKDIKVPGTYFGTPAIKVM